jgi:hypothetical protein
MRLTSDFFVSALVRRVFSSGGFAAVEHKGHDQAGAIFIRQRLRDGSINLFGPAPQNLATDDFERAERRFELRLATVDIDAADALIAKEISFDRDLWLVELEVDSVEGLFERVSA